MIITPGRKAGAQNQGYSRTLTRYRALQVCRALYFYAPMPETLASQYGRPDGDKDQKPGLGSSHHVTYGLSTLPTGQIIDITAGRVDVCVPEPPLQAEQICVAVVELVGREGFPEVVRGDIPCNSVATATFRTQSVTVLPVTGSLPRLGKSRSD